MTKDRDYFKAAYSRKLDDEAKALVAAQDAIAEVARLTKELEEARAKLNTPELHDFAAGVVLEAAHQRERWGTDHDGGKAPADWFWLIGYLAGKALHSHSEGRHEKALHHTITAASALANWHAAILGKTNMRPGIAPPEPKAETPAETAGQKEGLARPLVYLACPYSHPDREVRASRWALVNYAAGELMAKGEKVFSPISHTHPIAEAHDLPLGWDFWGAFDRAYIGHSHKLIVLMLDGWRESKGVQAEIAIAQEMGIPVEYMDPPAPPSPSAAQPSQDVAGTPQNQLSVKENE